MPLPDWIAKIDGRTNTFVVDPDQFYPAILRELGVQEGQVTQYWLEVAQGIMKHDFDSEVIRNPTTITAGRNIERMIRADDGRKGRWNLTLYPVGELDWDTLDLAGRIREIRKHYVRVRGHPPPA